MAHIKSYIEIKRDKDKIFDFIKDNMQDFPGFMKDIKRLEIIDKLTDNYVTAWWVEVEGNIVKWKEEDIFDKKKSKIEFKMIDGDYKNYEGQWTFKRTGRLTQVQIEADFDWGIPVLEQHVSRVLEKRAKFAFDGMLKAPKNKLEK